MSNGPSSKKAGTSDGEWFLSALGLIALIFLLGFVLYLTYLPNRPGRVDEETTRRRIELRKLNDADQNYRARHYGWVDRSEGVVRIPIEAAMALTVKEIAAARGEPAARKVE